MTGFINVFKPAGEGSTYTVGRVKKKLNVKCGHMGTLDPMASGVLPVGLGKATRLFDFLLKKKKTYLATFEFGRLTDTLYSTGKTVKIC
ncbi:MAG: tRNA pseudouridine(55) synthase TruB, partial [Clostridia bacterium]|nr:tRNA pseudouridine(55) synthase TruB [Clostridia bacterium]